MDKSQLNYFKMIGKIQQAVNRVTTIDDAFRDGLEIIQQSANTDCAIVWYSDTTDKQFLHPYYWVCPLDLTSGSYKNGHGAVGTAFADNQAIRMLTYKKGLDPESDELFGNNLNVSSMLVVPLEDEAGPVGCVQFLCLDDKLMSEEEADMCEILTMMVAMSIASNDKIEAPYSRHNILISARDITREYTNGEVMTKVLKGVNIDVYEGEFLALLGESGCGKSTLLNIIGGLDKATSGTFTFMGKAMEDASQEELTLYRRNNIGFIFQSYNLMTNLNAKQNLDLIGELVENPLKSEDALKLVKLEDRMDNYPSQLSGGQQQRVSIARALVKRPKLILADEPTAALDYETSIEVLSALENIIADGTTIVMVTHNTEITKMADRIVKIRDGKTHEVIVNRHRAKAKDLVW